MKKETEGISSLIGRTLAPDFSTAEDLGEALYDELGSLSPLLRSILTVSNPSNEGNLDDLHYLLELFSEGFERCIEEFDAERCERGHAATVAEKKGKIRKAA